MAMIAISISLFHLETGFTTKFGVICLMRVLHGAVSAAINPLSYSLIADYFPPEKRSRANAILTTGNYLGIALSSISILLIKAYGWRYSYILMGTLGVIGGGLAMGFMANPDKIR